MNKDREHVLEFRWGTSRGRNTYGYTICSLYVDSVKVASCNGGGYDMKGTVLGDWFAANFVDELMALTIPMNRRNGEEMQEYYGLTYHDPNYDPGEEIIDGKTVAEREEEGLSIGLERYQSFYRASSKVPTERHIVPSIDGACGMSSVEAILRACGYNLKYVSGDSKRDTYLFAKGV